MAAMEINDTSSAYSTIVAPSSSLKKLISFFIFYSPFSLVCARLCFVFVVWLFVKTVFLVSTLIMFYPLTHLLSLTLFQKSPTPLNFYLERTSHVQRAISNRHAISANYDAFPKIRLGTGDIFGQKRSLWYQYLTDCNLIQFRITDCL